MRAWAFKISLTAICTSTPCLAAGTVIGYDELSDVIRKNNRAVQASGETVSAARQRVGDLDRTFLPKAGFETGISEQKEANGVGDTAPFWKVDVQANVYRGGRDKVGVLLRESQILIKEMDAQALYRSEIFKAKTDYVQLYSIRQVKELTLKSMDDYDSLRKSINRKAQAGLMTNTAVQNSQLEVDELKRQMIMLESEEHELEDRLGLVLGLAPDEPLTLKTKLTMNVAPKDGHSEDHTIQKLPEIKKFELMSESTKLETQTRNDWWLPDVNVFASYTGFAVERQAGFGSLPKREMSLGVRFSTSKRTYVSRDQP